MPQPPDQNSSPLSLDERLEKLWKWGMRVLGSTGFIYVMLVEHGDVQLGAWVIIGGLIGLPNALPLSQVVAAWKSSGSDS